MRSGILNASDIPGYTLRRIYQQGSEAIVNSIVIRDRSPSQMLVYSSQDIPSIVTIFVLWALTIIIIIAETVCQLI